MKKTRGDIILHMCTKNYHQMMFLTHGARQTDGQTNGQTDGWMEKVTYRGGCPT